MNDLEYIDHGMFTSFIPVSKAGEVAFNQMAEYTEGKAKQQGKVTAEQAEDMLRELEIE